MYKDRDRRIRSGKRPLSILMAVALALPLMVAMASVGSAGLNDCSASADARNDTNQANSTTANPDTALIFDNDAEVDQEQDQEFENEHENDQSTDNDNLNVQPISADTDTEIDNEQSNEGDNEIEQENEAEVDNSNEQEGEQENEATAINFLAATLIAAISGNTNSPTSTIGSPTAAVDVDQDQLFVAVAALLFEEMENEQLQFNLGLQLNAPTTDIPQGNSATLTNPQANLVVFPPITGATVSASNTQAADGTNNNSNPQTNRGTQEQNSRLDNSITTGEISPRTRVDIGDVSFLSHSDARGGLAEGGDCTLELDQRTGDTGDVNVEATSGNVTQGDVTGGDGGDTYVEMGIGGDGGGGGAAGGSGDYAGAVIGNNNGGGGGGPGGPGGAGSCEDCSVIVTDSNNGGGAEGGTAQSGDVDVRDTSSGDSGDNTADFSESGDTTIEGGDEGPESGDEDSPNATNTND